VHLIPFKKHKKTGKNPAIERRLERESLIERQMDPKGDLKLKKEFY
jgi:hypothetical protein